MGCFLLGIIIISIVLMSNNSNYNSRITHILTGEPYNPGDKIGHLLMAQLIHNNNNPNRPLNYQGFTSNHPGHLNTEKKIRLVSIIRSSSISDQYRYGSSIANFYIKDTNDFPAVTTEMIGIVLAAETTH